MLTLSEVQETLPANHRVHITQEMVDQLNALSKDPEEARNMRENFVSFSKVLQDGKFKLGDYVRAVMYVSRKIMGKSNLDSYRQTFPERYQRMVAEGKPSKDIAAFVSAYNKGKLVNMVMEQAIVPTWILNQHMFQDALNTQFEIMNDINESGRVRVEAANSLLTHLKKPEAVKAELSVEVGLNDGMQVLQEQLAQMAALQRENIIEGKISARDAAHMPMKVIGPSDE